MMMDSLDAFLEYSGLLHLSQSLSGLTLDEFASLLAGSRPKCLNKLKDHGVPLSDRQKFGNSLSKAIREGIVPNSPKVQTSKNVDAAGASSLRRGRERRQQFDDDFDLASVMVDGLKEEDPDKEVTFKAYDDDMTRTAIVDSLVPTMNAKLNDLATLGVTRAPPLETNAVVVGAGLSGVAVAAELVTSCAMTELAIIEKTHSAGGVWTHQANSYSRVNSSEPAYRLPRRCGFSSKKDTPTNHTPAHQIIECFSQLIHEYELHSKLYKMCNVESVTKREDGSKGWLVEGTQGQHAFTTKCKLAVLCTNRRLGAPRELNFPGEKDFKGVIARGLNSDAEQLVWNDRVVIVGMGAFALEHMRTALERRAPYCSILCRRRGTVCPQVVDWVNFVRPVEPDFMKETTGSSVIQNAWRESYIASGAKPPDCWSEKPRMLKPDGHTVSTSDLFFVAHWLKVAATFVGEVETFVPDGIVTKDWGELPSALMPCGVVIKCVGFEINKANEKILGRKNMRGIGLVDDQLWTVLEAHLDKSFFSLPFGSSYLASANFMAATIGRFWNKKDMMAAALTTPINCTLSHFTAADVFDSMTEVQKVVPEVSEIIYDKIIGTIDRFNAALNFKDYLDRNETMWSEYHELLYRTTPVVNPRSKGLLPWKFRIFEEMVDGEWKRFRAREAERKRAGKSVELKTANYQERASDFLTVGPTPLTSLAVTASAA